MEFRYIANASDITFLVDTVALIALTIAGTLTIVTLYAMKAPKLPKRPKRKPFDANNKGE